MFNAVSITRPGIALGSYPERNSDEQCKWDKVAASLMHRLQKNKSRNIAVGYDFVQQVEQQSASLVNLNDHEITALAHNLQQQLRAKDQTDALLVKVFSLVREAAGRTLGMRHFKSQLLGGWVMAQGKLAEMETGEGKTLTATLPACAAALAGIPTHVITVNDYLVKRDAELMRPLYSLLGLTVGAVIEDSDPVERKQAYACDITYCTGKQVVFDYLRDRMVREDVGSKLKLQVDHLCGTSPAAEKLVLRGLCYAIVDEADSIFIDEARTPFILSKSNQNTDQHLIYQQSFEIVAKLQLDTHFIVHRQAREIELTKAGKQILEKYCAAYTSIWKSTLRREELIYQALFAQYLLQRDKDYLVQDGKVQIIDQNTGRVMPDRSWSHGLHQMVETKEQCELSGQNETLERITYQDFFRRYLKLSGMSGTINEVKYELHASYGLEIIAIPPNKASVQQIYPTLVYKTTNEKWQAVIKEIYAMYKQQRPVLVGTCNVADSEKLSSLLASKGLSHQVLNARQDKHEADVISKAGQPKQITIATNMAGRGTDIKLAPKAECLGGLHVISTQRNEARRIDRQLMGRSARQGQQGSYQEILSLQDDLVQNHYSKFAQYIFSLAVNKCGEKIILHAQRKIENNHARIRRNMLHAESQLKKMLAFTATHE